MPANHLSRRLVLVTGSVQGIGMAIASAFAPYGVRLVLHGLADKSEVEPVLMHLRALGAVETHFFDTDLRDPDAIDHLMDSVGDLGGLDILINNAGVQHTAGFDQATREIWDRIIAVNLSAAFHTMRRALPGMAERGFGRVINIASVHGLVASRNKGPYVASKFGLVGLSRVAALEYAQFGSAQSGGVTINCICPGWTDTPLIRPQVADRANQLGSGDAAALVDLMAEKQPTRRLSSPSEIGALAVWLAAAEAHNVTGASFPIDGGWTAQ